LPDGTPIPAAGWHPLLSVGNAPGLDFDDCGRGGSLTAALDPRIRVAVGARNGWEFEAPRDTEIVAYTLYRSGLNRGNRAPMIFNDAPILDPPAQRFAQEGCVAACGQLGDRRYPLAPVNRFERAGIQIRRVLVVSQCSDFGNTGPCAADPPDDPHVAVHASRIALSDSSAPAFREAPSGALLDGAGPIEGRQAASFAAEDRGGGLATVSVVVDGQVVGEQPADINSADCRQPYLRPVPCPLVAKGTVELDTAAVANGVHQIALAIKDAGGNCTLSEPVAVTVRNPGAPNGGHASRFARLEAWFQTKSTRHRTAATVSYGRTRAITGRLSDENGVPISDAVLDISATTGRPGSTVKPLGQVATDAKGRFRYLPRSGSSRKLTVGYRAFHLDDAASASTTMSLNVRAGVTLRVKPRRVSAHGRIQFTGRLRGGPGRAGTQVVIYALAGPRDRIPVTTVRANKKGRFHFRYRFQNSSPGTTYRFRATLHSQRSYPYATGNSKPATVRIR
jgi:hypothetical protein